MSLINDALNRAKAEAARRAAAERGEFPAVGAPAPPAAPLAVPAWIWVAAALLAVLVVVLWLPITASRQTIDSAQPATAATAQGAPAPAKTQPLTATAEIPVASEPSPAIAAMPTVTEPAATAPPPTVTASPAATPPLPSGAAPAAARPDSVPAPPAGEPLARESTFSEPAAGAADEAPPQPRDAPAPAATVWPGGEGDQEIWYYVDRIALPGGAEIELDGIAWSASSPSAILNGSLLRVGGEILGLRVVEIGPRTVILTGHGRRLALQLGSGN